VASKTDLYNPIARVRAGQPPSFDDDQLRLLTMNTRGDVLLAQALPPKAELVRLGGTWTRTIPTGSAFTHVAAWPTTRAELVLQNGEPVDGKSYILDAAWAANVATSIAAASAYTLLGQLLPSHATPVTDNANILATSRNGRPKYTGNARCAVANTTYGVASQWEVLAAAPAGPAASIGLAVHAELFGGWILPPGAIMLLNLVVGTAAGTASIGITWHEVQLPRAA